MRCNFAISSTTTALSVHKCKHLERAGECTNLGGREAGVPLGTDQSGVSCDSCGRLSRIFAEHCPGRVDVYDDAVVGGVRQSHVFSVDGKEVLVEGKQFSEKK